MKTVTAVLAAAALLAPISSARSQGIHSFTLQAESIGGSVSMSGGGTFDPASGSLHGGGGFRVTRDIVAGPLAGLRAGDGVRWEAAELLRSSGFKCGGIPGEPLKTATTDDDTVVMKVRFFRQGDGATPSFTANAFVSAGDENPDQP
ncbi:MAG: hypothetical protein ACM3PF_02665, partial [Bacteroidota bacterium]